MFKMFGNSSPRQETPELNKNQILQQILVVHQKDKINKKYEFPATFKKARLHRKAVKFGYSAPKIKKNKNTDQGGYYGQELSKDEYERPKLCACCNQQINTKSIGICQNTTNPSKDHDEPFLLDSSAAMFFSFIKMSILYLILVFLICGAFNLFTSIDGNYCLRHTQLCQKSLFEMISTYNKYKDEHKQSLFKIQNILCLSAVIGSIIFFIIYRKIQYNIYDAIDAQHQTQDDYTLFIENIPVLDFRQQMTTNQIQEMEFDYETKLKDIFENQINSWIRWMMENTHSQNTIQKDLNKCLFEKSKSLNDIEYENKIKTISLCFDLGQLEKINTQRQALMQQQIELHNLQNEISQTKAQQIRNQIQALNKIQLNLCERFAKDNSPTFNITHFVGKAFVTFEYQHYRQYIMQKYQDSSRQFKYGNKTLTISRASHPTDIYWTNMKVSDNKRTRKVLISYIIIMMILFFSAAGLVGIDFVKMMSMKSGKQLQPQVVIINYGLSIFASFVATVINYGIYYIVKDLTEYERHKTMTNKLTSMIVKIFISQFINTAFIFYLIQVYNHRPYLSSAGLVIQVSTLIIVSGCISIFTNAINIPFWLRKIRLWYKYGHIKYSRSNKNKQIPTYQIKLNKDYQYPIFDIAGRYSYYLLQVYTCMFYAYLVPVGVLAVALIFMIQFWIDKIRLFKLSSEYNQIGYFLSRIILKMFQGSLLVFTLGNLIFSSVIEQSSTPNIFNLISFGIAVLYVSFITFAPTVLQRKVFAKYQTFQSQPYQNCLLNHKFTQTYWSENPATVFAKQVDINDKNKFIKQRSLQQYYQVRSNADEINQSFDQQERY